jgi:type IV pilus assembly protein PilN
MMIRINLLPVRQVKKRELGRQVLVLMAVVLVLTLVLNYIWYSARNSVQEQQAQKISDTTKRIAELEKVIGEVNNINKRKKEVEDKLKILNDLRKQRSGPVRMMDALSTATPKKVWLRDFTEANNLVKLTGLAVSHEEVADFMKGLENIVWTPKGMGKVVERKRESPTVRVEVLGDEGSIQDFESKEVASFFTNIELKKATTKEEKIGSLSQKRIDFEINMNANYAI